MKEDRERVQEPEADQEAMSAGPASHPRPYEQQEDQFKDHEGEVMELAVREVPVAKGHCEEPSPEPPQENATSENPNHGIQEDDSQPRQSGVDRLDQHQRPRWKAEPCE